jgi:hypothetical protein
VKISCPQIVSFFGLLPLVSVVKERMVFVHGGLPMITPSNSSSPRDAIIQFAEEPRFIEQILWNDPKEEIKNQEHYDKSRRAYGFYYGKEITKK